MPEKVFVNDRANVTAGLANEVVVVDWNATLVVDKGAEDILTILEFANVELLENALPGSASGRSAGPGLRAALETLAAVVSIPLERVGSP
jgi:hypothetical protein